MVAISTPPLLATGILALQFQLEGQKLKGTLLLHLVLACVSSPMFCAGGLGGGLKLSIVPR